MQPYISTSASTIGRVVNWDFYSYFRKRGGNWLRRDNSIVWKLSLKNFRCNAFFHNCQMYCVLSVSVVSLGKSALIFNNFLFFSMALNVLPKSPQAGPFFTFTQTRNNSWLKYPHWTMRNTFSWVQKFQSNTKFQFGYRYFIQIFCKPAISEDILNGQLGVMLNDIIVDISLEGEGFKF